MLGYVGLSFFIFTMFSKIGPLRLIPEISTQAYLQQSPFLKFTDFYIQQPISSLIILILAGLTIALGLHYLMSLRSCFAYWIGVNFIFWGFGALFAGISYQAFGYALKCLGLTSCMFTDWIELFYMTLSVLSINAILVAYASLMHDYKTAVLLKRGALLSVGVYTIFQGIGMLIPIRFMLSYEGLLLFLCPNLLIFIILSYKNRTELLHHRLLNLWIGFILINIAYFIVLYGNLAALILKQTGFWFNENDTLHVLLIIWMIAWWIKIPSHGLKQRHSEIQQQDID